VRRKRSQSSTGPSIWPTLVVFAALTALIVVAGYLAWREQAQAVRAGAEETLAAVGDLKADEITDWLKERRADAEAVRSNPLMVSSIQSWLAGDPTPDFTLGVEPLLRSIQASHRYAYLAIVDTSGRIRYTVPAGAATEPSLQAGTAIAQARTDGAVTWTDLFLDADRHPRMDFVAPLILTGDPSSPPSASGDSQPATAPSGYIGAVILQVDPERFLFPLIQTWPLPSMSGETLLVERRGDQAVYLNDLRHRRGTALDLSKPLTALEQPGVLAVLGSRGVVQGVDYRGARVLADIQPVADTDWLMVAKVDQEEVLGAVTTRGWVTAALTGAAVVLVGGVMLLVLRQRRLRAAAALAASETQREQLSRRLDDLTRNANDAVLLLDADLDVLDANVRAEELYDRSRAELLQLNLSDLREADQPVTLEERATQIERSGGLVYESLNRRRDSSVFPVEVSARRIRDEGAPLYQLIVRDISERKQAEAELRASEERFRSAVEGAPVAIFVQTKGRFAYANPAALTAFGAATDGELVGTPVLDRFVPEVRDQVADRIAALNEQRRSVPLAEETIVRLDSSRFLAEVSAVPIHWSGSDGALVFFTDVTERREAEQRLRTSTARLARAQGLAHLGDWEWDVSEGSVTWSDETYRIFGVPPDFPTAFETIVPMIHPDDRAENERAVTALLDGLDSTDLEFRIVRPDGETRHIHQTVQMRRDEAGAAVLGFGVMQDVSELRRAEAELRQLTLELERRVEERTAQLTAANQELEAFSYSVSHDLRAPLRHIGGFTELLERRYGEALDDKAHHYMTTIRDAARQMGALIDDLLQFSRAGRVEMKLAEVPMDELVAETLERIREDAGERRIEWTVAPLPVVWGDSALLRQVWTNLLDNAVKYTRTRETAHIAIEVTETDGEHEFIVRDDGVGFDMAYVDKLFGVFQRLHRSDEFEGTGIGLANVRRIVGRLGGRTWADGVEGEGAAFHFSLPRRKEDTEWSS
jgi:PAS domain S-box-containing protein